MIRVTVRAARYLGLEIDPTWAVLIRAAHQTSAEDAQC